MRKNLRGGVVDLSGSSASIHITRCFNDVFFLFVYGTGQPWCTKFKNDKGPCPLAATSPSSMHENTVRLYLLQLIKDTLISSTRTSGCPSTSSTSALTVRDFMGMPHIASRPRNSATICHLSGSGPVTTPPALPCAASIAAAATATAAPCPPPDGPENAGDERTPGIPGPRPPRFEIKM